MNISKIKIHADIARYYYVLVIQTISFAGILALNNVAWWQVVLLLVVSVPGIFLLVRWHLKVIYSKEQEILWDKIPQVNEIIERLTRIEEMYNEKSINNRD